jgi:type I restriction enzyme R subunit
MLLTGFDAKRLKKLYIGSELLKGTIFCKPLHELTEPTKISNTVMWWILPTSGQNLTQPTKPILTNCKPNWVTKWSFTPTLFKSKEEIEKEIAEIKEILFYFDTTNAELFSQQITQIQDREKVLLIKKALGNAKSLYNLIRLYSVILICSKKLISKSWGNFTVKQKII